MIGRRSAPTPPQQPRWAEVWITIHNNGRIQATGQDAIGRRQYIYHPQWRERKDRDKFTHERVLAAGFRMLNVGSLRVGSERYAESNGSVGLTTLLRSLLRRGPDAHLLSYRVGPQCRAISANELNEYVRERTDGAFTAKDFRTLRGTPAVARRSYVDPRVIAAYTRGRTIDPRRRGSAESELRARLSN